MVLARAEGTNRPADLDRLASSADRAGLGAALDFAELLGQSGLAQCVEVQQQER